MYILVSLISVYSYRSVVTRFYQFLDYFIVLFEILLSGRKKWLFMNHRTMREPQSKRQLMIGFRSLLLGMPNGGIRLFTTSPPWSAPVSSVSRTPCRNLDGTSSLRLPCIRTSYIGFPFFFFFFFLIFLPNLTKKCVLGFTILNSIKFFAYSQFTTTLRVFLGVSIWRFDHDILRTGSNQSVLGIWLVTLVLKGKNEPKSTRAKLSILCFKNKFLM